MNIKKLLALLKVALPLLSLSFVQAQKTFYISPIAKTAGKGTLSAPFSSIDQAVKEVAKINKGMTGDITVYLRGGVYVITSPVVFNEQLSGNNGFNIIYKAYHGEIPVISGGVKITGWTKDHGNIYKATLNRNIKLRSLFINGKRAKMAGTENYISGLGSWGQFQVKGTEPWSYGAGTAIDGIKFSSKDISAYKNPEDIELVQPRVWTEKILCARDMVKNGDTIIVKLQQPYGAIATSMAWAGRIDYDKNFLVRNAYELLDAPGEFYFDKSAHTLYYYSQGEDMSSAEAIAPTSEGLIRIYGASTSSRAHNIQFEGITFSYDDWNLMNVEGSRAFAGIQSLGLVVKYVPGGNWHPTEYNSTDVPPGTVDARNCSDIRFVRNRFEHIGAATTISLINDVINTDVTGNYFFDMLGNSVNIGHPQHYKIGDGDIYKKEQEGVCKNINVTSNYVRGACIDFRQVEGITAFFVENVKLDHNDISGTPYGAIACGWWWGNAGIPPSKVAGNNSICYNKAGNTHLVLSDGGIIYALGEQPNSMIAHNYLYNGPRCIYPDDGSAYWTITDNAIMNLKQNWWIHLWSPRCHDNVAYRNFVKDNIFLDNGTNDIIVKTTSFRISDFSDEANKIIAAAGIEDAYKDIIPGEEPTVKSIYPFVPKER